MEASPPFGALRVSKKKCIYSAGGGRFTFVFAILVSGYPIISFHKAFPEYARKNGMYYVEYHAQPKL
jgi:hypothetical protein